MVDKKGRELNTAKIGSGARKKSPKDKIGAIVAGLSSEEIREIAAWLLMVADDL